MTVAEIDAKNKPKPLSKEARNANSTSAGLEGIAGGGFPVAAIHQESSDIVDTGNIGSPDASENDKKSEIKQDVGDGWEEMCLENNDIVDEEDWTVVEKRTNHPIRPVLSFS